MNVNLIESIQPIYDWLHVIMVPWGLLALCGLSILESLYLIGLFTPGEVLIVTAALVAAGGGAPLWLVAVSAWVGTFIGLIIGYYTGRWLGLEGVRRLMHSWNNRMDDYKILEFAKVDPDLVDDVTEYFGKHGALTTFGSRFAYGAKSIIPPIAGATRMNFFEFISLSSAGSAIYISLLIFVGWILERHADLATKIMKGIGWFAGATFAALALFAFYTIRRYALRRREAFFEAKGIPHEEPRFVEKEQREHESDE